MTSLTLMLSGNSSNLTAEYFPPIELDRGDYVCGLVDFQTYNSIPNIDEKNNKFYYITRERVSFEKKRYTNSEIYELFEKQFNIKPKEIDAILMRNQIESHTNTYRNFTTKIILSFKLDHEIEIPMHIYKKSEINDYIKDKLPKNPNLNYTLVTNPNTLKTDLCFNTVEKITFEKKMYTDSDVYELFEKQIGVKSHSKIDAILIKNNMEFQKDIFYEFTTKIIIDFDLDHEIEIPIGIYEIDEINTYIKGKLPKERNLEFNLSTNPNTLKTVIYFDCNINFKAENSLAKLLGFDKCILEKNIRHTSHTIAKIFHVNAIRLECNLISGAYINNEAVRTIHTFFPQVSAGYKIVEIPSTIIYLPVAVKTIHTLNVRLVDQDGHLVNFRGETITIRLHIKPNIC